TDHYMQILANQAPIGFEAEFVNQRNRTILYRGILLPFSSDDETIDFIYGVINWKELADQATTDELLLEIDQALEAKAPAELRRDDPLTEWADGPADTGLDLPETESAEAGDDVFDLAGLAVPDASDEDSADDDWAEPAPAPVTRDHGRFALPAFSAEDDEDEDAPAAPLDLRALARAQEGHAPLELDGFEAEPAFEAADAAPEAPLAIDLPPVDETDMALGDWLASARELAEAARGSEDRTRSALYAAIGRAYDFSLAAAEAPEEFAELVADSGLTAQDRAPMTPVVKLVFGADYDKTRLAEYATALSHAQRIGLGRGSLGQYLAAAPGGLKGVVSEERRIKRGETAPAAPARDTVRTGLAKKLRKLPHAPFEALDGEGAEFTLLVARRLPDGEVVLLGEIADDIPLLEKAAKKLLG
ncbi:MAG TPA: hypothetical protein VFV30_12975, partial [Novosphingobium sp.]|nr:hypothetical protein [Novosphingobium sp.]